MTDGTKQRLKSPNFTAPLLVLFVILAMLFSRRALTTLSPDTNVFVAIGVIQLSVLGIPCIVYYLLKGRKLESPIPIISKSGPQTLFVLFAAIFFVCGMLLIKFFYFVSGETVASLVNFYETDSLSINGEGVRQIEIILSLIVIPAVCEEFLFRGVLFGEYLKYGTANAVTVSAVCFAMLHFSAENFFVYLFAGLLFGFVAAMTRSIFPSMALHLLSNTLSIYASDSFLRITVVKNGAYFIGFVLAVLTGLSLVLLLSRAETICYHTAEKPHTETIPPKSRKHIGEVFFSPGFLLLLLVFIAYNLLF